MATVESAQVRETLRRILRLARFESWTLDAIEDAIDTLYREGVTIQPPVTPDQLPEPP